MLLPWLSLPSSAEVGEWGLGSTHDSSLLLLLVPHSFPVGPSDSSLRKKRLHHGLPTGPGFFRWCPHFHPLSLVCGGILALVHLLLWPGCSQDSFSLLFPPTPHFFSVVFCPFLNTFSQRCHRCHWRVRQWLWWGCLSAGWSQARPLLTAGPAALLAPRLQKTCVRTQVRSETPGVWRWF